MVKKGLSNVVASVLLIFISITLAILFFMWAKNTISSFSPPLDCQSIVFRVDIYKENEQYYIDIVNLGPIEIEGVIIKSLEDGEVLVKEQVEIAVPIGKTNSTGLSNIGEDDTNKKFLIVPMALYEDPSNETIGTCPDDYGETITI